MKTATVIFMIFLTTINYSQTSPTTIYLIRHAEKADSTSNTELSKAGKLRAENWAKHFKAIKIAAVYSTDYNRTLQTAAPIAKQAVVEVQKYSHREFDLKKLAVQHPGQTIVIIGHSNTIPGYVNSAIGTKTYDDIAETEFGIIFEVTFENNSATAKQSVVPFRE
jgi:2,3-bisphosphoglycerate-dependent phosphoglycerate mutase